DDLGLACGPDNRMVNTNGGWTTSINDRHEVEWTPPPPLDTGQARINYYHRPEALLRPPEEPGVPEPRPSDGDGDGEPIASEPIDPEPIVAARVAPEPITPEELDPEPSDHTDEPGGPAPPDEQAA
ncbi:MAG: hypothetical protein WBB00_30915, partial [Mycobacterium sp.]